MTFLKGGARKRRDKIEAEIIAHLRARGAQTWQLSGRSVPDLLVWHHGHPIVLEIKSGKAPLSAVQAHDQNPWPIVRSVAEAVVEVFSHAGK